MTLFVPESTITHYKNIKNKKYIYYSVIAQSVCFCLKISFSDSVIHPEGLS
jgi:hypothetical protein